jgi:signal transduction histidine kinase
MGEGFCQLSAVAADFSAVTVTRDGSVPLSAAMLEIVLGHLASNALAHGATSVALSYHGDHLIVADDGAGISQGNRDRIFEPFFTTNRDGGGTGMGLAIVRRMLGAHGASISLLDGPTTRFEIRF